MRQIVQHGIDLLARAGDDEDLLGMSLIYLHGGLEAYFRSQLEQELTLFKAREQKHPAWPDLINLLEEQQRLSDSERTILLEYNKLRNSVAHAKTHQISRERVERYANFVQKFTGIRAATRQTWRNNRLTWLIPIVVLILVIIGGIWAINTSPLNQPPPLPPTITPISPAIRPAVLEPPTVLTPPIPVPTPAESSSSAKPTQLQLALVQVDTAVPLATYPRTLEF